jgi:hypothetical protein
MSGERGSDVEVGIHAVPTTMTLIWQKMSKSSPTLLELVGRTVGRAQMHEVWSFSAKEIPPGPLSFEAAVVYTSSHHMVGLALKMPLML